MTTSRVYSPANEPFDVTPSKASDLVLNKGWTQTPVTTVEIAPAPEPVVYDTLADADDDTAPRWRSRGRGGRKSPEAFDVDDEA